MLKSRQERADFFCVHSVSLSSLAVATFRMLPLTNQHSISVFSLCTGKKELIGPL